jgi:tetratricopeptide (TPR) repeat protein
MRLMHSVVIAFILIALLTPLMAQQNLTVPRSSPYAEVTQRIGLADITVTYHRPGVKDRKIWGELVPYDQIWRAGANENTVFKSNYKFTIDGKELPAGSYGLHILPTRTKWTIIFSKVDHAWGSFSYDASEDVLRVSVKPEEAPFRERLMYYFDNLTDHSVELVMHWEKIKISVPVSLNLHGNVLASMRSELRGLSRFFWQAWNQAADYCLQNNVRLDEAMEMIDRALSMNGGRNFSNLRVKSELLDKKGDLAESGKLLQEGFQIATENELNQYGYQLLFADKYAKAEEVFKLNIERHPDSWNTYDSLGEAYDRMGKTKLAVEYYTEAFEMVKDETQKKRIGAVLERLKSK